MPPWPDPLGRQCRLDTHLLNSRSAPSVQRGEDTADEGGDELAVLVLHGGSVGVPEKAVEGARL
jgi:hypothetical protein